MTTMRKTFGAVLYMFSLLMAAAMGFLVFLKPGWFDAKVTLFYCMAYFLAVVSASCVFICPGDSWPAKRRAVKMSVFLLLLIYCIILCAILFTETYRTEMDSVGIRQYAKAHMNLTPFQSIRSYFPEAFLPGHTYETLNLIGNILLFAPMGILLPALLKWQRHFLAFLITMIVLLVCVELGQLYLKVGYFDVDDIIMNLSGALAAYLITKLGFVKKLGTKLYLWDENPS